MQPTYILQLRKGTVGGRKGIRRRPILIAYVGKAPSAHTILPFPQSSITL